MKQLWWLPAVGLSFGLGYFLASNSSEVLRLRSDLDELKSGLSRPDTSSASEGHPPQPQVDDIEVFSGPKVISGPNVAVSGPDRGERAKLMRDRYIGESAKRWMENRDIDYTIIFTEFGLPVQMVPEYKAQLTKIRELSSIAGSSIADLMRARNKFQSELRTTMGEENFARYKEFEETKDAIAEYQKLAKTAGAEIPADVAEAVIALIRDTESYSAPRSWMGPFSDVPAPVVGAEAVTRDSLAWIEQLSRTAEGIGQQAESLGLTDPHKEMIADYYNQRIEDYKERIEYVKVPVLERIKQLHAERANVVPDRVPDR